MRSNVTIRQRVQWSVVIVFILIAFGLRSAYAEDLFLFDEQDFYSDHYYGACYIYSPAGIYNNFGTMSVGFPVSPGVVWNEGIINNHVDIANYQQFLTSGGVVNNLNPNGTHGEDVLGGPNVGYIENVAGTFEVFGTGSILNNEGLLINGASFQAYDNATIDNSGFMQNAGTSTVRTNATFNNTLGFLNQWGDFYNQGTFTNSGGTVKNHAGEFSNEGTFDNTGGTFDLTGGTFANTGTLKGDGTFAGTLDTGSGIVAPGNSAGTMTVDGDYILDGTGTLEIEVGGFGIGEFDLLDITGTAFLLGGTIDLMFLEGYDINTDIGYGESLSLMFLEAALGIDSFASTVTYDFLGTPDGFLYDVYQQDNSLWFQATNTNIEPGPGPGPGPNVIPAPGAILLGSFGIGLVSWLRRHRTL